MRGHTPKPKSKNFMIAQESHITGHPHPKHFESTDYFNVAASMNMPDFIDKLAARKKRFEPVNMHPRKAVDGFADQEYKKGKSLFAEPHEATRKPLASRKK